MGGVRRYQNPDGTLTSAGKLRYSSNTEKKKFANLASKHASPFSSDTLRRGVNERIRRSPQVQHAANSLRGKGEKAKGAEAEYRKKLNSFYKDEKLYNKYLQKAVDAAMKKYNYSKDGMTREDILTYFKYDDWDQGNDSSIELYKRSSDKGAKELALSEKKWNEAEKDLRESAKEYVDEFLGEYGDKPIGLKGFYFNTAKARVAWIIEQESKRKKFEYFPVD